jgi:heat-inducible transcriptional repressor
MQAALSDKLTRTLEAVVTSYIRCGRPIGSKYIADRFRFGLSPASIRNHMAALEDMGFLRKPHTSAGRVPTEKGYRLYVDRVMKALPVTRAEARAIRRAVDPALSVDRILERIPRLLESLSHQMCIATTPQPEAGIVIRLETVRVAATVVVVRISIGPGRERTVSVRFDSVAATRKACSVLNGLARSVVGKSVTKAREAVSRARTSGRVGDGDIEMLSGALNSLLDSSDYDIHIFGAANVISKLGDIEDAKSLLEILESRQRIVKLLLTDRGKTGTTVCIGSENHCGPMRRCSIVRSTYWMGEAAGAIGLIGPLRMEYPRLMALVDYTSQELTRYLAKVGGK